MERGQDRSWVPTFRPEIPWGVGRIGQRVHAAVTRSLQALVVAARASRRVRPRRCVGAVQASRRLLPEATDIHGWAWFEREEVASCFVTLNGCVVAEAELRPPTLDVAEARPETVDAPRCGWHATIDLAQYAGEPVVVGAIATSHRGVAQYLSSVRATVGSRPPSPRAGTRSSVPIIEPGAIEVPAQGATVPPGRLQVIGWALPAKGVPARLEVRVNGRDAGRARVLGVARPDVAAHYAGPTAPVAGFEHLVTVDGRPGDLARIDVDLVDAEGDSVALQGVEVRLAAPRPLVAMPGHSDVLAALDPVDVGVRRVTAAAHLRLAVFTHSLELGGGELYLQELLRDLLKNADMSCLVVSGRDGPLRDELEQLGAVVHITDYPLPDTPTYEGRVVEVAGLLSAYRAQLVVVNTLISAPGADAAGRLGWPCVWAIHESYTLEDYWVAAWGSDRAPSLARATARTLGDATAVLFEAEATRAVYARAIGEGRLVTLHYGIDLDAIQAFADAVDTSAARRLTGLPDDAIVLTCVGNFEPRKGQAALVAAFALVADEFPRARLALVGGTDSAFARAIADLVGRLGLEDRVLLQPIEANPYRWYRAADGFVMASDLESLPRVLLEAMAFGLPVVATDVWGIPELVRPGENGILVQPRDVAALADALRTFLRLPADERARLGDAGSRLVRERHDLDRYRRAFEGLLRGLVADPETPLSELLRL